MTGDIGCDEFDVCEDISERIDLDVENGTPDIMEIIENEMVATDRELKVRLKKVFSMDSWADYQSFGKGGGY